MEKIEGGIELTGTIYTSAKGDAKDKLAMAEQIYDSNLGEFQSEINKKAISNTVDGVLTADGFKTPNGTSSAFLKADGTLDNSSYTKGEYVVGRTNNILGDKWIRIAEWTAYQAYGVICIANSYTAVAPSPIIFSFTSGYGKYTVGSSIVQIGGTNELIERARIVAEGEHANATKYIDIKLTSVAQSDRATLYMTLSNCIGCTLIKATYLAEGTLTDSGVVLDELVFTDKGIATPNIKTDKLTISNGTSTQFLKADGSTDSNEYATMDALQKSKKALFIDLWERQSVYSFKYKYYPETDTFGGESVAPTTDKYRMEAAKYILKDMTYDEALLAYNTRMPALIAYDCFKGRMNVMPWGYQGGSGNTLGSIKPNMVVYNDTMEVLFLSPPEIGCNFASTGVINNADNIKAIIGKITGQGSINPITFSFRVGVQPVLEYMTPTIKKDFDIQWLSKLTLFTMEYIVQNAMNTSTITIITHPDVYAKLTGDVSNPAYTALTEAEKAQWTALVSLANGKNIQFATI